MTLSDPIARAALDASFLAEIDRASVEALTQGQRLREIPAGRVFINQAQPQRCGLVVSGLARAFTTRIDGSEVTLRRVGVGAAVGIRALLGRRNQLSVQAITDVVFLDIDAHRLVDMACRDVALAMAIAAEIDRRLEDTEIEIGSIRGSVLQRVAGMLLDLSPAGEPLEVRLSEEELAAMIGASRKRVGNEVRILAQAGLVQHRRGRFILVDAIRLQAIARDPARDISWHARVTAT